MNFFRKNLLGLAIAASLAFVSVSAVQAFHHHDRLESRDDCSLCVWQQTGSQASSTPLPPVLLFDALVAVLILAAASFYRSFVSFSPLGRAPPHNLL
jgi:hypothetical protein